MRRGLSAPAFKYSFILLTLARYGTAFVFSRATELAWHRAAAPDPSDPTLSEFKSV